MICFAVFKIIFVVIEVGFPTAIMRPNIETKFFVCLEIMSGRLSQGITVYFYYTVHNKSSKTVT